MSLGLFDSTWWRFLGYYVAYRGGKKLHPDIQRTLRLSNNFGTKWIFWCLIDLWSEFIIWFKICYCWCCYRSLSRFLIKVSISSIDVNQSMKSPGANFSKNSSWSNSFLSLYQGYVLTNWLIKLRQSEVWHKGGSSKLILPGTSRGAWIYRLDLLNIKVA